MGVAVLAAAAILLAVSLAAPGGTPVPLAPQTAGACGVLPVSVRVKTKFPQVYARQYKKAIPVELTNRGGYRVGGLYVQVYTFGGLRLGSSPAVGNLRAGNTKQTTIKLGFPIQTGKVTFVVKGTNKGCPPGESISHVVAFHSCKTQLPLTFPNPPGGFASDYGEYLSVPAEAEEGQAIFHARSRVYKFDGQFVGEDIDHYSLIYGKVTFNNRLRRRLAKGGYTMVVTGRLNQPKSCGAKTAQVSMGFK
ncbi:MAG TPA: hypothetical protein VMH33_07630 [Solirubrobacterales bacterium]|nr:hypothetical protein [Solirubrobacterales bacterium]